ncbi:phosphatase PAP2 family protein [Tundrisphaera sp. TA3]|uniref:phosphatase PAP2 family protein n=1 Tax=Tundrisphaera sp. TA3 TaxID=3435775 RepID=UPI003EBAC535
MANPASRVIEWLGGHELAVLVGTSCLVAATWGFIVLSSQVTKGNTHDFDNRLLMALRVPGHPERPIGPEWMSETARDITALGSTVVLTLATLGVVIFLGLDRRYGAMTFVAVSVLGGWLLSSALKAAFDRPRPDLVPHLMRAYFSSYPSGHSMMSAVVYLTLGGLVSRLVTPLRLRFFFLSLAATLAVIVGLSRIYLGVHYPTDVLAGWTAGGAWATLCWLVGRRLQREGRVERAA